MQVGIIVVSKCGDEFELRITVYTTMRVRHAYSTCKMF